MVLASLDAIACFGILVLASVNLWQAEGRARRVLRAKSLDEALASYQPSHIRQPGRARLAAAREDGR